MRKEDNICDARARCPHVARARCAARHRQTLRAVRVRDAAPRANAPASRTPSRRVQRAMPLRVCGKEVRVQCACEVRRARAKIFPFTPIAPRLLSPA